MTKDYSIQGTTKLQREKYISDAIALSTLDAPEPSEIAMSLLQEYIDGKCELADARERIVEHYKAISSDA
ncbi:MAG: hypothetical protein FWF83_06185 [Clostridiales bacterium]|nr:hypothetical protein [Clostridiales bacterium]